MSLFEPIYCSVFQSLSIIGEGNLRCSLPGAQDDWKPPRHMIDTDPATARELGQMNNLPEVAQATHTSQPVAWAGALQDQTQG